MSVVADKQQRNHAKSIARENGPGAGGRPRLIDQWAQSGWLAHATAYSMTPGQNPLAHHANWFGPVKLIGSGPTVQRMTEVFLSHELLGDQVFAAESKEQFESLLAALSDGVFANRSAAKKRHWRAPATQQLVDWLAAGGFPAAVGDEGDLRLTLKARGCDGQVLGRCDHGRLRFSMRLGAWSSLDAECEKAMLYLARQANDCGRLARIAGAVDQDARRCEAQVDLTGLPTDGPAKLIWPDMLCMSIHALELALRRLGMELDVLADPANRDIATQLIKQKQP
jgi:hypothetical protein